MLLCIGGKLMSDNNRNNNDDFKAPDMREIFKQYTTEEYTEDISGTNIPEEQPVSTDTEQIEEQKETLSQDDNVNPPKDEDGIPYYADYPEPKSDNILHMTPIESESFEDEPDSEDDNGISEPPIPLDDFGMPSSPSFAVNLTEDERQNLLEKEREERAQAEENADKSKKGFKGFIRGLLPWKGDPASEIIRKCVFLVAIVTVFVSCGMLIDKYLIEPNIAEGDIGDVQNIKNTDSNLTWDDIKKKYPDVDFPEGMQLKYAEIYAQNTDLVGWLTIDRLQLDFPILQTDNNDYYLKRSFTHKYTELGNPFLNCENSVKTLDRNTIIYGHSTRTSNKIFSKLFDYRTVRGFVNNPVIEFNTIYKDYKWKVYAVFITNATKSGDNGYFFNYIFTNLSSDAAFESYIAEIDRRKLYTTGVDILPSDKILTLSTCLYDFDSARLVIVARMVRDGESEEVDTSLAKANPNPQYPQAWYDKKGGTNPYKNVERWYPN